MCQSSVCIECSGTCGQSWSAYMCQSSVAGVWAEQCGQSRRDSLWSRVWCARQLVCDKAVFLSNSFHREIWVVGWFGQCQGDHFSSVCRGSVCRSDGRLRNTSIGVR